ncbi:MAG: homoserine kinase [Methylococcaceae bacterium]|nr:MAG: homoserine kinase [Methylococcaceae bacterium]
MSAYTALPRDALAIFLDGYAIGTALRWQAIRDGIENSNYFLHTGQGEYVLTLFENLAAGQLPPYLALMRGLARHGLSCPQPLPNRAGLLLGELCGKPALLTPRLPGASLRTPGTAHCRAIGAALATVHANSPQLPAMPANAYGLAWQYRTAELLQPRLDRDSARLLADELAFQQGLDYTPLPRGLIHGDLFRDNALFAADRLSGVLDWYEAGSDAWLYDVAVTANDWCGADAALMHALLAGYAGVRSLTAAELAALPAMLRTAALRFWLSRLLARLTPRNGHLVHSKDPDEFKQLLLLRRETLPLSR